MTELTDERAADLVRDVKHSAEAALDRGELVMLDNVEEYLRSPKEDDA